MKTVDKINQAVCSQCKAEYRVLSDNLDFHKFQFPPRCTNVVEKASYPFFNKKVQKECAAKQFELVANSSVFVDYQEIKVQDQFQTIKPGTLSNSLPVMLEADLVNRVQPGDDIVLGGFLVRRWKQLGKN